MDLLGTHLVAASLSAANPALPPPAPQWWALAASEQGTAANPAPDPDASQATSPEPDDALAPFPAEDLPPDPVDAASAEAPDEALPPGDFELELGQSGLDDDPLEGFNRVSFDFSQAVDKALIRPVAMLYRQVVPEPLRAGVHNIISNLGEPLVFLNDFLQLRFDRMIKTLGRFLVNTVLGVGGLFDIAKRDGFNLPHHPNSFGDTLGYYGVGPGPYIYVPILGPTTLRDAVGGVQGMIQPRLIGMPFNRGDYSISKSVVDGLDLRERNDDALKAMLGDAIDPYATFRADYLQDRAGEIAQLKARDGEEPGADQLGDPLVDPDAPPPPLEDEPAPPDQ